MDASTENILLSQVESLLIMLIHDMREELKDIPGLSIEYETNGHQKLTLGGKILEVGPMASNEQIRAALSTTPLPTVNLTEPIPMTTPPPPPGGFAASIRAMMDEARAGVEKARSDGLAQVQGAVGKLNEAKAATTKVAGQMASTIENEAAAVLSELGQISNDLGI